MSHPIFLIFLPRRAEQSARHLSSRCNTLEVLKGREASPLLINLKVEPRASLTGNASVGDRVPGSTPQTVCRDGVPRVVYPGIY